MSSFEAGRPLRDTEGKQHVEGLAIIFAGSYNNGNSFFPGKCTPNETVDQQFE